MLRAARRVSSPSLATLNTRLMRAEGAVELMHRQELEESFCHFSVKTSLLEAIASLRSFKPIHV